MRHNLKEHFYGINWQIIYGINWQIIFRKQNPLHISKIKFENGRGDHVVAASVLKLLP